jgi:hypothetical protein
LPVGSSKNNVEAGGLPVNLLTGIFLLLPPAFARPAIINGKGRRFIAAEKN